MPLEHTNSPDFARTYARIYPLAKLAVSAAYSLRVHGTENIPDGPAIYAANHNTVMDPLWLAVAYYGQTHQPLRFLAKKGYFDGKGLDDNGKFGRITQKLVTATGQIPVDRENGRHGISIEAAVQALDDEQSSVGIFPEGTLSEHGQLAKLHAGIARIALRAEQLVPIVPVALHSEDKPHRRTAVSVTFGEPIDISKFRTGARSLLPAYSKARLITENLEIQLAELTGYTRTKKYAKPGEVRRQRSQNQ